MLGVIFSVYVKLIFTSFSPTPGDDRIVSVLDYRVYDSLPSLSKSRRKIREFLGSPSCNIHVHV